MERRCGEVKVKISPKVGVGESEQEGIVKDMDNGSYMVKMDNPNITMEEYIRLEEEKAQRHAIVYNDGLTSKSDLEIEPPIWLYHLVIRDTHGLSTKMKGTKEILHDFKQRLEMIFGRQVNRVNILDFEELTSEMRQDLAVRLRMVYTRRKGQLAPEKVIEVDLFDLRSTDRGTTNIPHLLAQYLFRHVKGRKSGARLLGGHIIRRLTAHFGLVSAPGPERQQVAAAVAHKADVAAPAVDEGIRWDFLREFTNNIPEMHQAKDWHNYRRTSPFGSTNEFPTPMTPSAAAMAAAYAMLAALFNMYYFCCCLGSRVILSAAEDPKIAATRTI
nr:hypothetical protein [Tanacetum cinerariifolium]